MITHRRTVSGEAVEINVVEREEDLDGFRDFISRNLRFLGLDSETTGLNIYQDDFRVRLVQFGTPHEAWVVPVELGRPFEGAVIDALEAVQGFVLHNASFDLQVFERTLGVKMETVWPKVWDTKILAHLVDPRAYKEGGTGHKLEELTKHYIDAEIAENVKGLMNKLRLEYKTTKEHIWKKVDLFDERYTLYAGMDPILAARLMQKLLKLMPAASEKLIPWERQIAEVCSYIERTGFLLDVEYSTKLSEDMLSKRDHWLQVVADHGVEKVGSTEQCADALESMGVKIKGRTPTGKRQVNSELLEKLAIEGNPLAEAITEAKKWGSWEKTWVRNFILRRDSQDRVHPGINPLQARTARMSITNPATQNLPAGDFSIRRCFIADEGHRIASVDYQAQELRVLAALSKDQAMIEAFRRNADLHQITADAAGVDRKVGKMANFQKVYGGGAGALSKKAGISYPKAKEVHDAFSKQYPGVERLNQQLQAEATSNGYVMTPSGRRLPVDVSRPYSALNYVIQCTSREVTCRALLRLHEAGYTPYVRLPIHDEVLASLPESHARWGASEIGRIMAEDMGVVHIGTDPEVGGRSWGSLYGADT